MPQLVIVSHYAPRGRGSLIRLLADLFRTDPGTPYDLLVVCNADNPTREYIDHFMRSMRSNVQRLCDQSVREMYSYIPSSIRVGIRDNTGMNIGAWDWGWRAAGVQGLGMLFLQDEVNLSEAKWLSKYQERFESLSNEHQTKLALIGESWNSRWDHPWEALTKSAINASKTLDRFHQIPKLQLGRVDKMRQQLKRWHIPEGETAGHLRSLVWYTNHATMIKIGGFRIGTDYDECVAAEVATTRMIVSLGGVCRQLDHHPFRIFWHPEWRRDGLSKI